MILDGAAVIHMLQPGSSKTFSEYFKNVFFPYIDRLMRKTSRLDVVFDRYFLNSLKADAREGRGSGQRVQVSLKTVIPTKFNNFLSVNENKEELFHLLADVIVTCNMWPDKVVICTFDDTVKTNVSYIDVTSITPTNVEEADGRILLHAKHAVETGHTRILIRTVDSDVVVIAVYAFKRLQNALELWIDFGIGKMRRYIAVHLLATTLRTEICDSIPFFHAFTGCDTGSSFNGIGKKKAWNVWMKYRVVDDIFNRLSTATDSTVDDASFETIQRFVVLLYDQSSDISRVNECRRILFTKRNRPIDNIPPTADALLQHLKRATLQAKIWCRSLEKVPTNLHPVDYGWKVAEGRYKPLWITQPDVTEHCSELIKCACKRKCTNCTCIKHNLSCSRLCACDGHCSRIDIGHQSISSEDAEAH